MEVTRPMTDSSDEQGLDDLVRGVIERYAGDPERQRSMLVRLRLLELADDPDVMAARESLSAASSADLDAAFDLAVQRPSATIEPRQSVVDRLAELGRALTGRAETAVERIRQVFEVNLALAGGVKGAGPHVLYGPGAEPTELPFLVPADLARAAALGPLGRVETGDGELRIVIPRRGTGPLPRVAVTIVSSDDRSTAATLVASEGAAVATVDWLTGAVPEVLIMGIVEVDPTA